MLTVQEYIMYYTIYTYLESPVHIREENESILEE